MAQEDDYLVNYSNDESLQDLPQDTTRLRAAGAFGPHPDETEHLKAQIEETRNQMGETIEALQEKLSYSNISEQVSAHVNNAIESAKNSVYDATVGKAAGLMKNINEGISQTRVVRTARNNPFPFILIGLGTGLLIYRTYTSDRNRGFDRTRAQGLKRSSGGETAMISDGDGESLGRLSSAVSSAYEGVSWAVDSAYTGSRYLANRAYSRTGEYGQLAQETYDRNLEENPLAVGAAAFAIGAFVGFAIPSTRYEGELMGEAREGLLRKARDTGTQLLDRTKQLVDEAARSSSKDAPPVIH